jgi:hypothetical protein
MLSCAGYLSADKKKLIEPILQPLHEHLGASVKITSGYRSDEHNAREQGKPNSHHLYRQDKCAADFRTAEMSKAWEWLKENKNNFCYAYWDKIKGFIHVSGLTRNDPRAGRMWIDDENGRHFEPDSLPNSLNKSLL